MKNDSTPAPVPGKALQNILTLVQFACLAALVAWVFVLKRDLGVAEQELATLRQRPAPDLTVKKDNQALRARVADLELQVAAANAATAAAAAPVAPAPRSPVAAPAAPAPTNTGAALAAAMNSPAMRTMMATIQKRSLETRYGELFTQLQLTPEQRARFLEVLTEGQSGLTEAGLKLMSGNLGAAEQAALRQQIKELSESTEPKIRELLGDDARFALYKQFNDQQPERTQLNALKANLVQSGQPPLTAEQSTALATIMYEERKTFRYSPSASGDPANPMAIPTAEAMETRHREQEQLQNRIADRAAAILSPEQLAALRRDQARQQESLKTATDVARQMLGGAQSK